MPAPRIQVQGAKELRAAIRRSIDSDLPTEMKAAHLAGARLVEVEAERIAPRRSGTLAGSIRSSGTKTAGIVRAGKKAIPYAGVIHFGWPGHNIEPNPFIYDATDNRVDQVIDRYEDAVEQIARRIEAAGA